MKNSVTRLIATVTARRHAQQAERLIAQIDAHWTNCMTELRASYWEDRPYREVPVTTD